ncbi:LysR substrate-binding domain-containing protein [Stappia stellulata]|uniref:LysR substrate-binding domain-containing protein n=1 Tax=Stappia stellulata TaxID=71235 RepID=UPI00040A1AE0|nr:LysR substrate-binding domain-containing protein [Stappia stellulata]
MKITTAQLDAFSAVLDLGTATAAASVLNTSQPSITRAIKQLEDATGLLLFNRTKGRLVPTADARDLARVVLENHQGMLRIQEAAKGIRRRRIGHLRIACLPAFTQGFIARALSDFLPHHPHVSIFVRPLASAEIRNAVSKGLIDIGIAAYEVEAPGVRSTRFTECAEVAVLPREHPLAARQELTPADLATQRIVRLAAADPYRTRLDTLLSGLATDTPAMDTSVIEVETSAAACALAAEGVGIAVVNPLTALDFVPAGLVLRRLTHMLPFVTTLVRPAQTGKTPLADAFARTLATRRDADLGTAADLCGTQS